jgi:hypothetical protein
MKIFLTLLLFTGPVHAWTLCWNDQPNLCSTEVQAEADDPTQAEIDAWDAEQAEIDTVVNIFNTQIWNDEE